VSRISRKKADIVASQTYDDATLEAAAALTRFRPDSHPSIIKWLEHHRASDGGLNSENIDLEEVPLQGPRRHSEEVFRRSWNGFLQDPGLAEAAVDVRFDQLRITYLLGGVEASNRNDSGSDLVDGSMQPDAAANGKVEPTDIEEAELLELTDRWETRNGRLKDLIEEHAATCRKLGHESCWE
jgi:hypothetical protein